MGAALRLTLATLLFGRSTSIGVRRCNTLPRYVFPDRRSIRKVLLPEITAAKGISELHTVASKASIPNAVLPRAASVDILHPGK